MINAIISLTRIDHGIFLSVATLFSYYLASHTLPNTLSKWAGVVFPLFVEIFSFTLNDILDFERDKLNKRLDRPLVRGDISIRGAWIITIASFFLSLLLLFLIPKKALPLAIAALTLSVAYDFFLKNLPVIGNLTVGILTGLPFLYGNLLFSENIVNLNLSLFLLSSLLSFIREIVKDIEDMEGEKLMGAKTLPIILGNEKAGIIASLLTILFAFSAGILLEEILLEGSLSSALLLGTIFLSGYSAGAIAKSPNKDTAKKVKMLLYLSMFSGFLSVLLFSLHKDFNL